MGISSGTMKLSLFGNSLVDFTRPASQSPETRQHNTCPMAAACQCGTQVSHSHPWGASPRTDPAISGNHRRFIKTGVAIAADTLKKRPGRWGVMVRNSLARDSYPARVFPTSNDAWVWSQWRGYLNDDIESLKNFMAPCGPPHYLHTSGHASPELLLDLAEAMAPKHLLAIHGEAWECHQGNFTNLHRLNNGQWLEV